MKSLTPFEEEIATQLRARRAAFQATQAELGEAMGLSQSQTSKVLLGLRPVTVGQLARAADFFGVYLTDIIEDAQR